MKIEKAEGEGAHIADPDPFGVISLVVATVAMVAQLISLKVQIADSDKRKPKIRESNRIAFDKLKDGIEDAIRNTERLIKVLGVSVPSEPLQNVFEFGEAHAFFSLPDFERYRELIADIGLNVGEISTWVLHLIRHEPDFVALIGDEIAVQVSDVAGRINRLHRDRPRNEVVLEDCLHMLRTFAQILDRLDRLKN